MTIVHIVTYEYGSYDECRDGVLAIYATEELAQAHVIGALEYHDKVIVPLIKAMHETPARVDRKKYNEGWDAIDKAVADNPWHRMVPTDDPESYRVGSFSQEVLEKLPA